MCVSRVFKEGLFPLIWWSQVYPGRFVRAVIGVTEAITKGDGDHECKGSIGIETAEAISLRSWRGIRKRPPTEAASEYVFWD